MKIFGKNSKEVIKLEKNCSCGTPLPNDYKYKKCVYCRRNKAKKSKNVLGTLFLTLGSAFVIWFNRKNGNK